MQTKANEVEGHDAGTAAGLEGFGGVYRRVRGRAAMVRALAVAASPQEAEATRRRLQSEGRLRDDLKVAHQDGRIWFPVTGGDDAVEAEFQARERRPRDYTELLPESMREAAPRAHDVLGDIVAIKIPSDLWDQRDVLGDALLRFHGARAVFHDHGVKGEFRTRDLERIAGAGGSETTIAENGVRLTVDPGAAYYSPRLGEERRRMTEQVAPDASVIDLFGGVAPLGVQLAKAGATVTSVDLNPAACSLATRNAMANGVELAVRCGDARDVAATLEPADHVVMNLPHLAKEFIASGVAVTRPGGRLHHHEIMEHDALERRQTELVAEMAALGRNATIRHVRKVRDYSTNEGHYVLDIEVA